jgi:hypothetical protein
VIVSQGILLPGALLPGGGILARLRTNDIPDNVFFYAGREALTRFNRAVNSVSKIKWKIEAWNCAAARLGIKLKRDVREQTPLPVAMRKVP